MTLTSVVHLQNSLIELCSVGVVALVRQQRCQISSFVWLATFAKVPGLRYVMLCCVVLCYAMLCYVMSWHVMSCHVMLCCVVRFCVVLCCVMLRCVE